MNVDFVGFFFLLNAIDQNFRNIGSKNSMDVVRLGIVPSSGINIFKNNKFYQCTCNLLNDNNAFIVDQFVTQKEQSILYCIYCHSVSYIDRINVLLTLCK